MEMLVQKYNLGVKKRKLAWSALRVHIKSKEFILLEIETDDKA